MKVRQVYIDRSIELLELVEQARNHKELSLRISRKHWQAYRALGLNYRLYKSHVYVNGIELISAGVMP